QKAIDNKEELILDEFHFRMPDGTYRYFYDRAYILYNAEGKPYRMLGSMMDVSDLKSAEEEKEKARYQLNERVKELTTLYQSGQILQTEIRSIEEVLKEIVVILPSGWQYPEITAARITLGKMQFATSNFGLGPHLQSSEFVAPDGETGKIEVVYLEKKPQAQEDAFVAEERNLINMVAEMLRVYLVRKKATEELMKSEANLKTIFETTDDGYALLDIDFGIVSYNQRGIDFLINELKAKPGPSNNLLYYIPEERRTFLLDMKEEVVKGKNINYEISYQQPDHSYKWYNIRMFSITNSEKKVLGLMIAASDITEMKLMEQEMVSQKIQEQKKIIRAVLKAEEKERNKIGQELHDNVSQILTGTKLFLSLADKDEVVKKDLIKTSLELLDSAIQEIRSLSKSQVTPLKGVNLEALIYSLADKLNESSALKATVLYSVSTQVIEDDLKLNIYRIVQEQTNNILKYAGASNIWITIKEDYEFLYLQVEDDGKGFDPAQKRNGIGISNMINRVESFNGEFEIDSSPGNGCRLKIKIPY
ncbi:MAG: ATP-binding protein, partial [Chitinophagaceae bacterium]